MVDRHRDVGWTPLMGQAARPEHDRSSHAERNDGGTGVSRLQGGLLVVHGGDASGAYHLRRSPRNASVHEPKPNTPHPTLFPVPGREVMSPAPRHG
jgi:hypothetical protein